MSRLRLPPFGQRLTDKQRGILWLEARGLVQLVSRKLTRGETHVGEAEVFFGSSSAGAFGETRADRSRLAPEAVQ